MKSPRELRDRSKHYRFYYDYDDEIEERHDLWNQIDELICKGYLGCYEAPRPHITFEARDVEYPDHDDALVILVHIVNAQEKRLMVDINGSTDIHYYDAFLKLGLIATDLTPLSSTLTGFISDSIAPLGITLLPITLEQEPRSKTMMVTFMVVNLPLVYNVILVDRHSTSYE
ncbi:hypothetical protein B296_00006955 [Ensete ventricosum]|uniref:Uncharacterized protein n=1 Tax=Ensete ventricosum TaxID=4639 RepID=A0A426ZM16_ENSVE|nr:hypothetical protein B296_00006955 [Ensete ventricosum]